MTTKLSLHNKNKISYKDEIDRATAEYKHLPPLLCAEETENGCREDIKAPSQGL